MMQPLAKMLENPNAFFFILQIQTIWTIPLDSITSRFTILSIAIHLLFLTIAFISMKQTMRAVQINAFI